MSLLGDLLKLLRFGREERRAEHGDQRASNVDHRADRKEYLGLLDQQIDNAEQAMKFAANDAERKQILEIIRKCRANKDATINELIKAHAAAVSIEHSATEPIHGVLENPVDARAAGEPPMSTDVPSIPEESPQDYEERLSVEDDQLQYERHHIQKMAELNEDSVKLLERQLEKLQRRAGVDPEAPLSATATPIPEDIQESMLEALRLLKDIRSGVEQLAPASTPRSLTADDHTSRAKAYYHAGEYHDALAELNRALDLRPDDADTLTNRGVTFYHLKRYDDALADSDRALDLRPDHAVTLTNRGAAFYQLERYDDALTDYNRSLELRPDHADTLTNRGVTLHHMKRYDDALADYNRALDLQPGDPTAIFNRACVFSIMNRTANAVEDLAAAIAGDSNFRHLARTDLAFDNIRSDPRFQALVGEETPPAEDADG